MEGERVHAILQSMFDLLNQDSLSSDQVIQSLLLLSLSVPFETKDASSQRSVRTLMAKGASLLRVAEPHLGLESSHLQV